MNICRHGNPPGTERKGGTRMVFSCRLAFNLTHGLLHPGKAESRWDTQVSTGLAATLRLGWSLPLRWAFRPSGHSAAATAFRCYSA